MRCLRRWSPGPKSVINVHKLCILGIYTTWTFARPIGSMYVISIIWRCRYNIPWNPLGRKDVLWMPMVSQQPFAIFIWNEAWELCCCSFMESGGQIWRTLGKRILYGLFIYQHVGSYVWFLCLAGIISSSLPRKFCWFSVDDPHGDLKWLEGKL